MGLKTSQSAGIGNRRLSQVEGFMHVPSYACTKGLFANREEKFTSQLILGSTRRKNCQKTFTSDAEASLVKKEISKTCEENKQVSVISISVIYNKINTRLFQGLTSETNCSKGRQTAHSLSCWK